MSGAKALTRGDRRRNERLVRLRSIVRRDYVYQHRADEGLREAYNTCITWIQRFRSRHLGYARSMYSSRRSPVRPTPPRWGTGSTPFLPYLRKHRDETAASLI